MPIHFAASALSSDLPWFPSIWTVLPVLALVAVVVVLKWHSMGATNTAERQMHGKVIIMTGATSGIGAVTALSLAQRGAQLVLLVHQPPNDLFLLEFIDDLREKSGNELIYAEQVDLSSLFSIRQFATKWIDNAPPRRLDMLVLCGATLTPPGKPRTLTDEGLEENWMVNYLANFHLLSILSPAIRAQPMDRDVRIIFATCSSYLGSPPIGDGTAAMKEKDWSPTKAYARSKLALTIFGQAFQQHLDAYKRPDGVPNPARVIFVDPGFARTPGMRRWLSRGTLWGLALYMVLWQNAWLWLKSAEGGAQSFLYAAMEVTLGRGPGGKLIKECQELAYGRSEVKDEKVAKKLWEASEKLIERVEREEAVRRALEKKEKEKEKVEKSSGPTKGAAKTDEQKADDASKPKSRRQKKAK